MGKSRVRPKVKQKRARERSNAQAFVQAYSKGMAQKFAERVERDLAGYRDACGEEPPPGMAPALHRIYAHLSHSPELARQLAEMDQDDVNAMMNLIEDPESVTVIPDTDPLDEETVLALADRVRIWYIVHGTLLWEDDVLPLMSPKEMVKAIRSIPARAARRD